MAQFITHNPHLMTYKTDLLTLDILGGVDRSSMERMVVTLRITYQDQLPYRSTLDLYNDEQTDSLLRKLCDRWELRLVDVSTCLLHFVLDLETYRLEQLQANGKPALIAFEPSEEDHKMALKTLKSKTLIKQVVGKLKTTGIIGEDDNATILFMALASHKFNTPFSVLCLAKSGMGKSYLLQKLTECMPPNSFSFHSRMTSNALYYMHSYQLKNKALLIEDVDWTAQMLSPLATLQTQGKLIHTRTTKNKDGMLHATTFELVAKLCLVACAYAEKKHEQLSLPFLLLHLNHSQEQDQAIMDYQRRVSAGQVAPASILQAQHELKCLIHALENVRVVNPYAPLIELPKDVAHPRKSLLLLLNFIEVVTFFFQRQRRRVLRQDSATIAADNKGEEWIETHPDDIALAFRLLQTSLFRRADELSTTTRGFYNWLEDFLTTAQTRQFMALDIRKARAIHPRTLNRYLQELKLYGYIKITGGNKHREGYRYRLTGLGNQSAAEARIEKGLKATLNKIKRQAAAANKTANP